MFDSCSSCREGSAHQKKIGSVPEAENALLAVLGTGDDPANSAWTDWSFSTVAGMRGCNLQYNI